jgi:protocatechuate 3,4-dioxygenase beta subunit
MGRRNSFLVVSLLVMIAVLIGALVFTGPGEGGGPMPGLPGGPPLADGATGAPPSDALSADVGAEVDEAGGGDVQRTALEGDRASASGAASILLSGRLVDADGQAVPSTEIRVYRGPYIVRSLRDGERSDEVVARTRADAEGRFSFSFPAGSDGQLALGAEGDDLDLLFERGGRSYRFAGYRSDGDLGDITLVGAARISGVCVDGAGLPVAAVKVRVRGLGEFGFNARSTTTSADGSFTIGGIRPGEVEVSTSSPDFTQFELRLELQPGEHREDLQLRLEGGARMVGFVVDDLGRPIAGATVGIGRWREFGAMRSAGGSLPTRMQVFDDADTVETDESGRFELEGLDRSRVSLRAVRDGHQTVVRNDLVAGADPVELRMTRLATVTGVVVDTRGEPIAESRVRRSGGGNLPGVGSDEAITDADGRFELTGVLPGRATLTASGDHRPAESAAFEVAPGERVENVRIVAFHGTTLVVTVLDPDGKPVEGARVRVREPRPAGAGPGGGRVRGVRVEAEARGDGPTRTRIVGAEELGEAVTDAEGVARIGGLEAGSVEVVAEHELAAAAKPVAVELPRDGVVESLVTLRRGARVEVSVVDAAGEPVVGAEFVVRGGDLEEPVIGETGGDGLALLDPLPGGNYEALLQRKVAAGGDGPGFVLRLAGVTPEVIEDSAVAFSIPREGSKAPVSVSLQRPELTRVHGRVLGAEGPVAGASITLESPDDSGEGIPIPGLGGGRTAKSQADGSYEFVGVEPGRWRMQYSRADAIVPHEHEFEVAAAGFDQLVDLVLAEGTLRVQVLSSVDGAPIAGATVRPLAGDGSAPRTRQRAVAISFVSASDDGAGTTASIDLGGGGGSKQTGPDGVAELVLPAGTWRVEIRHDEHAPWTSAPVEVPLGSVRDLGAAELEKAFRLDGTVVGGAADGPLAGAALVEVETAEGERLDGPILARGGAFRVPSLAAGSYRVRARAIAPGSEQVFSEWQDVVVGPDQSNRVELRLP